MIEALEHDDVGTPTRRKAAHLLVQPKVGRRVDGYHLVGGQGVHAKAQGHIQQVVHVSLTVNEGGVGTIGRQHDPAGEATAAGDHRRQRRQVRAQRSVAQHDVEPCAQPRQGLLRGDGFVVGRKPRGDQHLHPVGGDARRVSFDAVPGCDPARNPLQQPCLTRVHLRPPGDLTQGSDVIEHQQRFQPLFAEGCGVVRAVRLAVQPEEPEIPERQRSQRGQRREGRIRYGQVQQHQGVGHDGRGAPWEHRAREFIRGVHCLGMPVRVNVPRRDDPTSGFYHYR
ncbi:MAG: hypothetical protein FJX73_07065 [Armatimonadetes bacterium]|nr:hypothetical protein [Armatimonadota bacterium]